MGYPIAAMNRAEIRKLILAKTGAGFQGEATTTATDHTSLLDSVYLYKGATDEYKYRQVIMVGGTAANLGLKSVVASSTTGDATLSVSMTTDILDGDAYQMVLPDISIEDIDELINEIVRDLNQDFWPDKVTETVFTEASKYEYDCLSGFKAVSLVEYCYSIEEEQEIDDCDTAWTAGTNTAVTLDTTFKQEGSACNKIVVAGAAGDAEILAYHTFSSIDLSDCTEVEISIYSTVALTAGYLQLRLDDTLLGGSAVESLAIPATAVNTWTRHKITLANPLSDTAIIRAEIYQVTDVTACTLYIDFIKAVKSSSRIYKPLLAEYWSIVHGTTPKLMLTDRGLSMAKSGNTLLRLTGYQTPTVFSDETTDGDVDGVYVAMAVSGGILVAGMVGPGLDTKARREKGQVFLDEARRKRLAMRTNPRQGTRWC